MSKRTRDQIEREAGEYIRTLHATMNDPKHRKGYDRTANELLKGILADAKAAPTYAEFMDVKAIFRVVQSRAYGHRVRYRGRANGMVSGAGARRDEAKARRVRLAR